MIISEQWLRDWVKVDLTTQQISDCLTNAGLEVDGIEQLPGKIENLVVGRILSVEKHPDADRLNLTKVDIGTEQLDIVCGAKNAAVDLLVAVATVGAKLPNGLKIKRAKVRGIESNGMLCSAAELGLEESSDGILELDCDAEIGQAIDEYLQLDDSLIDIDLTPNRGDCLSIQGIARELKVLADGELHPLEISPIETTIDQQVGIKVEASDFCPTYLGRVISGVDVNTKTPLWMQERLRRCNVRPISPVVDITNYVMLELGQPMHAFDKAKINGDIGVRLSKAGESLTLLDDSEAKLDDETLLITDDNGPIAIAGVMGGADSAIGDATTEIILEAAHFTRKAAAGRARRYGLHTESSHRFERGVDPSLPKQAIERATELVLEICGGEAAQVCEASQAQSAPSTVSLRFERLQKLLGMPLEQQQVSDILHRIAENVDETDDGWNVVAPSYRFDVEREADLVEEVARVKGYDSIPTNIPRIAPRTITASEKTVNIRKVREHIAARDYFEAITYSFIATDAQSLFSEEAPIELDNPLAENMSVMRTSLLPGLLSAAQFNHNRQRDRVRLFEIGATYHAQQDHKTGLPTEIQRLAGVATGARNRQQWSKNSAQLIDFYDIKSDLEAVISLTGKPEAFIFEPLTHIALHPGQASSIAIEENGQRQHLGFVGRLHPNLEQQFGFSDNVFVFELDLDQALLAKLPEYKTLSKFPSIKRDLSVLVNQSVNVNDLVNAIKTSLGVSLVDITIFDLYQGEGVADGFKSVSMSLTLQNNDRTMTDEEAEQLFDKALGVLTDQHGAELRT